MARKSQSRIVLEVKYKKLREKLQKQIKSIKKSAYAKDVEASLKYYEPRVPAVSKLRTKRDLEKAVKEVEFALEHKVFVQAERKRQRQKALERLRKDFDSDSDVFKTWRDARKFYDFMNAVREHSQDIIFDSYKATEIFVEHNELSSKEILKKYVEYSKEFERQQRSGKRKKTRF